MDPLPSRSLRNRRASIVEIAARLKVSPSTVSRALRSETAHLVKEDRRKAIFDLAEKLHFSPNPGAHMLRRGVIPSLTVVVPLDENIFFSEFYGRFLSGTLHAAAARQWDVHISSLGKMPASGIREKLQSLSLKTSGVVYLGEPLTEDDLQKLRLYRRPLVLTKSALPPGIAVAEVGVPVVGVDNLAGARSAARLLLQLGHRRIGLLLGPSGSRDAFERKAGYLEVLARAGVTPKPEWIFSGPFSTETGRLGIESFQTMSTAVKRPTALCCASDEIAFGAIAAARACGLRCPEDISIVGFDDGQWATSCWPTLTTVRQPLADLAERAVGLIVEAATHPGVGFRSGTTDMLAAALVIRDSTRSITRERRTI